MKPHGSVNFHAASQVWIGDLSCRFALAGGLLREGRERAEQKRRSKERAISRSIRAELIEVFMLCAVCIKYLS